MKAAPRIKLVLHELLAESIGTRTMRLKGQTVQEVLEKAFEEAPALRHHLLNETGGFRPHILVMLQGKNIRQRRLSDVAVQDGDEIRIVQAISGG